MIEVSIDKRELEGLIDRLEKAPAVVREAKRRAFEVAAPKLKQALDNQIPLYPKKRRKNDEGGKVRGWQEQYVGSKGGYAAVRPKAKTYTEATRKKGNRYAVGYVTNAINSGHRFPSPSGRKYYKPRVRSGGMNVPGQHYYQDAEAQASQVAQEAAREILDAVKQHLEG